jgi:ubiquinone/menaquinone biosynthesis C-methylase UbiE
MNKSILKKYLSDYLKGRPLFLSLIRAKEAALFHDYLPLKSPVLDVGCGDGFFAKTVFGRLDVGLDVADSRIKEAENTGAYGKLIVYDGRKFPFPDRTFATVVSNCVLEHIPDIKLLISEMHRVLKPGGKALLTAVAKPWEDNLFGAMLLGNSYKGYMQRKQVHINMFTSDKWREIFKKSGFKITKTTGYVPERMVKLIDVSHYLSLPSLVSYKLTGKWVLLPNLNIYPADRLADDISPNVAPDKSGAVMFELTR